MCRASVWVTHSFGDFLQEKTAVDMLTEAFSLATESELDGLRRRGLLR